MESAAGRDQGENLGFSRSVRRLVGRFELGRDSLLFAYKGSSWAALEGGLTSGGLEWQKGVQESDCREVSECGKWWLTPGYRQVGRRGQICDTFWRCRQ